MTPLPLALPPLPRFRPPLAPTPENIGVARTFLLRKWQERHAELKLKSPVPDDLSDACKFTSLFAASVFGGAPAGNSLHQFAILEDGTRLDLNEHCGDVRKMREDHADGCGDDPDQHCPDFWGNPDHLESMSSCLPRAAGWITAFALEMSNHPVVVLAPAESYTTPSPRITWE